jgi:hypothetical protein
VPGKTAQSHRAEGNGNQKTTTPDKPPTPTPSEEANHANDTAKTKTPTGETSNTPIAVNVNKDRWDYAYIAASLLIAIATLVLARIAWVQARAAKASTDALVNAERARIIAELTPMAVRLAAPFGWSRFIRGRPVRMSKEEIDRGDHLLHSLKFINMGRTVAHISAYQIHFGFFNWRTDALNVEEIIYNGDFDRMLEGSQGCEISEAISIKEFINNPDAEINNRKIWMIILVSVTYAHVFSTSEPERDVFRFIYDINDMSMKRREVREADRIQCRNGTISPLTRKAPSIPNDAGEEKKT